MSVSLEQKNKKAHVKRFSHKKILVLPVSAAVFVSTLALCGGNAWSLNVPATAQKQTQTLYSSSPAMADACLPLLKSIRHTSAGIAMDRNQRSAGQAAALGLVFGVRFALGPSPEPLSPELNPEAISSDAADTNRTTFAIANYRQCQKDQLLKQALENQAFERQALSRIN